MNGKINIGENVRAFPISNWTELDVWNYIRAQKIKLPSLYFAHKRNVFERDGMIWAHSDFVYTDKEIVFEKTVRFRTVGDMTCTAAVDSLADNIDDVINEITEAEISERGARIDDKGQKQRWKKEKNKDTFKKWIH